jgi:hypothetical protein
MKRVRINSGWVGLVFQSNEYKKVITAGKHWVSMFATVRLYNMASTFIPPVELNLLLKDEALADLLIVLDVKDNQIALQYADGVFVKVLKPGRHVYWKGVVDYKFNTYDLNELMVPKTLDRSLLSRPEVIEFIRIYVISSFEKGLLYVDGNFNNTLDPGTYYVWNNNLNVHLYKADLRQQQMEVSGQEMLTKDKAAVRINFFALYKIVDIVKALAENSNYVQQLYVLMQLALREFVGMYTLDELLEKRESIAEYVLKTLSEKADRLGVNLLDCGVRDIILPGDVKEIMSQVLVAEKKAQASVITRREETASVRSMLNSAKLMDENPMLWKLKEMEYVEKIADKINTISLSGGNQVLDQLRDIFTSGK